MDWKESEKRLIKKIQRKGDRDAADELIAAYYDDIYRFCYKQLFVKEEALDITQEIFIAALRGIHGFDHTQASFKTWLYRIAANKTIDFMRQNARRPLFAEVAEDDLRDALDLEDVFALKEAMKQIMRYVQSKDIRTQQIFQLKYFDEKSFSTIAASLTISENTVKTTYYRLLKALREELNP